MTRAQLEHVVRASGAIADSSRIAVIGSQAILASFPDAPETLLGSMEADVYPLDDPAKADVIDGAIGEGSPFHEEFGYYAHGVGPETAVLPSKWIERAVKIQNENTGGVTAICPSAADLAVSKLAAGRPKDVDFVRALLRHGLLSREALVQTAADLPAGPRSKVESLVALIQ